MWQEAVGLARPYGRRNMPITYGLLALIAAMFVLEGGLSSGGPSIARMVALGAQVNSHVLEGQWWRILTAIFLHFSWAHILLNGWSLYVMGELVEPALGSRRFLGVFLLSGVMGGLVSLAVYQPSDVLAGASGAIFGLLGATAVIAWNLRGPARGYLLRWVGSILLLNLAFDYFNPAIGIWDHIGGLVGGVIATYMSSGTQPGRTGIRAYIGGAAYVILAAFLIAYAQRIWG